MAKKYVDFDTQKRISAEKKWTKTGKHCTN